MTVTLADALAAPDTAEHIVVGTITASALDGSVTVDLGAGRLVPGCDVLSSYTPRSGAQVMVARRGTSWLVLGERRDSNAASWTITSTLAFPFNVLPAAPGGGGSITVSATGSGSWRSSDGWSYLGGKVGQGAYTPAYGYYRGMWVYGSGFTGGGTATAATIKLGTRLAGSGSGAAVDVWVAPHTHATIPSGEPYFPEAAVNIGTVAIGAAPTLNLPLWIAQGLLDGIYKGVGLVRLSTADYMQLTAQSVEATSGRIVITRS